MCQAMFKLCKFKVISYAKQLTDINKYPPLFPGRNENKKLKET